MTIDQSLLINLLRRHFAATFVVLALVGETPAQAPRFQPSVKSPEVLDDASVVFRIRAADAESIRLTGSDLPQTGQAGLEMKNDGEGVWELTVKGVAPGSYRYRFDIGGVTVTDPVNPITSQSNGNVWSMFHVPGDGWMDWQQVPHGAIAEIHYDSDSLGRPRRMHIYTPPGYERGSQEKYPVFYLLHGAMDCDDSWSTVGRAGFIIDNLIAKNLAEPMVVVMPAGHTGSFSFRQRGGMRMDEFVNDFVGDIKPYVEANYRVHTDRANTAIAGLSMGGAQTLDIAIPHLDEFGYFGVFSSGVFGITGRGFGSNSDAPSWEEKHKQRLDDADLKAGLKLVWFATGKDDFLIETSRATVDVLKKHGFDVVYEETAGGHTWNNWREYLHKFAQKVFRDDATSKTTADVTPDKLPTNSAIVTFTTRQDHENMMQQLGITKLRPGPSGNPDDPNSANYDEATANPFPDLPKLLTLQNGEKITTAKQWWDTRRPEIVEDFEREVIGRIPDNVPDVKWELLKTVETKQGEIDVIEKRLVGRVDNSGCPEIEVDIMMSVVTPKDAKGPVPVLMMFGFTLFGSDGNDLDFGGRSFRRPGSGRSSSEQLIDAGWGYATINANSIQEDSGGERQNRFGPPRTSGQTGGGLTRGIIGLTNKGQPRKPDQWGSLRAWGWGASRGLDYLQSDPAVDATRVGIEGVSRYGKAALVTMAFDQRFAAALVGSSGEGGASLYRRNFGEAVENLTGSGEYHWMAGNFLKYGAEESTFGAMNASDLPVDAHQLIALCAPRPIFISYGIPEKGDAKWLDQQGSFMAAIAAQPVYRLLGARDLGRSDDYMTEKMPEVNVDMLEGELAWRQHDGGHTDGPNIEHFIRWANAHW